MRRQTPHRQTRCKQAPLTRRHLLTGAAAAVASPAIACLPASAQTFADIAAVPSLGAIAAARGVLFGTAFDVETLDTPRDAALYRHHARILTTDLTFKFGALRPLEGPAKFDNADRLVAWAAVAGIPLRGHALVWNEFNPPWVSKLSSARRAYWLDRHIDEVAGRYAGRLHSWDVVNEPFWPGHGKPGGFRDGPWLDAMGPDYVVRAMQRARAADPTATLAINEAGPEWENPFGPTKPYREGLLSLIDRVQQAGVTVDAVGLQCHWFPDFEFNPANFRAHIQALSKKVRSVYLTEIDVNDGRIDGDIATRDTEVARRYRLLVETALKEPSVTAIITWQLSDNASWIVREPKLWATPSRAPRPLPFDASQRPKPAYHALAAAFAGR
ncbi:MAG: endo-1,4-beta-xylanase [Hyphomicrobiaceae bacterium]|nr:endo-1,4-beta-xylanase [Hyphomicrobiaceae bacterium]